MKKTPLHLLILITSLSLAACSSDDDQPADTATPVNPTTGGTPADGTPPTGDPAVTPPAGDTPVVTPPATDPPVGSPPVVIPPTTNPPAGEPPEVTPPVTDPPADEPPVVNPPVTNGNSRYLGIVEIDTFDGEVDPFGVFLRIDDSALFPEIDQALATPPTDVCTVATGTSQDIDDFDIPIPDFDLATISAGDTITLSSPAGTYATLLKTTANAPGIISGTFYGIEDGLTLPAPAPSGLVVDIPGDEFPAVSGVAIPDSVPLEVNAPAAGEFVTAGTQFQWNPGSGNAVVFLSATWSTGQTFVEVDCVAQDDGVFDFPAATQQEMGADFAAPFFFMERSATNIVSISENVILVTTSYSVHDSFF